MTTIADIKTAKAAYEDHMSSHHCTIMAGPCRDRAELWLEYMKTAEDWGRPAPAPDVTQPQAA